ncbi:MAG: 5-formyltetrahydrofolate cyclo-ligase [Thermodesulfobacteria bacterium]|nr:5-formyltetrahydrofolate cyclo-ligase [Thermodesulfobacteriota bacterium]
MERFSASKKTLRKIFLARRASLTPEARKELSRRITEHLRSYAPYRKAERLLLYAHFRDEVETDALIEAALQEGKEVYLPRTYVREKRLRLFRLFNTGELLPGAYGIPEPPAQNPEIQAEELDLIVVPGVAFDLRGGRLGYGGGFYDRLFAKAPRVKRIGLAYSCQVAEELPLEEHDVLLHALVTEKGLEEIL